MLEARPQLLIGPSSSTRPSCKELNEAQMIYRRNTGLSSEHLALLGTLGSVLPALETVILVQPAPTACSDWRKSG